jgi:hypothetical protein
MTRWFDRCRVVWFVVSILLMAQPVCAQIAVPARPYRSLFGGDDTTQQRLHELDLTLVVNGATDNGLTTPVAINPLASPTQLREFEELYATGAELVYARHGRHVRVNARGSTTLPYYSLFPDEDLTLSYGTSANVSYAFRTASVDAFGSYLFSPYYSMPATSTAGPGPSAPVFDFASALNPNILTSAGASWTNRFGRRTSLSAGYFLSSTSFVDEQRSNHDQSVRLSADHQLSRSITFRGSYGYRDAEYVTAALPTTTIWHDIDAGFTYIRRSPSGRTGTISGSFGASIVDDRQTQYPGWRATARGAQTVGVSWTVGADYSRTLQAYGGLQQPVWVDLVGARVAGRFGRRVDLTCGASYSSGENVSLRGRAYNTYSGTARVQMALTAFAAITAEYIYYRYDFPVGFDLPAGMPRLLDRQRVQFGARFWLPLVRGGRASDPRVPIDQ